MADRETYEKLNDYTLSVFTDFERQSGADPALRRIFNFKAQQVTEIYSQYSGSGVSNSMVTHRFSDFDSQDEIELMRETLKGLGGHPPETEKASKPARPGPALQA